MSRFYRLPREYKHRPTDCSGWIDTCVPDQALSVRELLAKYSREQKPLPVAVDYDIDSVEKQYDIELPNKLSRADALHLMDVTRRHMDELEYRLRETSKLAVEASAKSKDSDSVKPQE